MNLTLLQQQALEAVEAIVANQVSTGRLSRGASASDVAHRMGLKGTPRHGNGAVKGSWSGDMAPALRISKTLEALARRGLIKRSREYGEHRAVYYPIYHPKKNPEE